MSDRKDALEIARIVLDCNHQCSEVAIGEDCMMAVPLMAWQEMVERADALLSEREGGGV